MATFPQCSACWCDMFELQEVEAELCFRCQDIAKSVSYFEARIRVELDPDILEDMNSIGMQDTAIINDICSELLNRVPPRLTGLNAPEFTDCKISRSTKNIGETTAK